MKKILLITLLFVFGCNTSGRYQMIKSTGITHMLDTTNGKTYVYTENGWKLINDNQIFAKESND